VAQESPPRIHSHNQIQATNQYNKYSHHPANHSGKTNVKANKMAQSAAASDNKKRKLTSIINHKEIISQRWRRQKKHTPIGLERITRCQLWGEDTIIRARRCRSEGRSRI